MTDYPTTSGDGQNRGASASQTDSGTHSERQASGLGSLQEKAAQDFSEIREAAKNQASQALDKSAEMAAEKKNYVAEQLSGVAEALEKVGGEMKDGEYGMIGRYARDLGGSARRLATDLKNRDMSEVVSMAENFGRRQPVAFLGLAALAGLAASRFVTASAHRHGSHGTARTGAGAMTSANPMAGRANEFASGSGATNPSNPAPQASHSTTGQSSAGQSSGTQAGGSQSGMGQTGAGQAGASRSSGLPGGPSPFSQDASRSGSGADQGTSRPAGGMEATGIGGTGLGTSRDRPSSSTDTPTLSPSGPNPHPAGRVSIGETSVGQSSVSPASPQGQSNRPNNSSNEGRSHV